MYQECHNLMGTFLNWFMSHSLDQISEVSRFHIRLVVK